jgi:hypothetical protein
MVLDTKQQLNEPDLTLTLSFSAKSAISSLCIRSRSECAICINASVLLVY